MDALTADREGFDCQRQGICLYKSSLIGYNDGKEIKVKDRIL